MKYCVIKPNMAFLEEALRFLKNPYLTIPDVAALVKCHPNTVHNWIAEGLPSERQNGTQRIRMSKLVDFVQANKGQVASPPSIVPDTLRRDCNRCGASCCGECGKAACQGCAQ